MDLDAAGDRRKCNSQSLMNGERRRITTLEFIKKELRDGMTKESRRRILYLEIRYYFLISRLNYSSMENYEANGNDHSR